MHKPPEAREIACDMHLVSLFLEGSRVANGPSPTSSRAGKASPRYALPLPDDKGAASKDVIYVVSPDRAAEVDRTMHGLSLATKACEATQRCGDAGDNAWLLVDAAGEREVLSAVSDAISQCASWANGLMALLASGAGAKAVLDEASRMTHNPIALFDDAFVLVATGGNVPNGPMRSIWTDIMASGHTLSQVKEMGADEWTRVMESREPTVVNLENETRVTSVLRDGDAVIGYLGMTDLVEPIDSGQIAVMRCAQSVLERSRAAWIASGEAHDKGQTVLERMLSGQPMEGSAVSYFLSKLGIQDDRPSRTLLIVPQVASEFVQPAPALVYEVREELGTPLVLSFEDAIVAIADANAAPSEAAKGRFHRLLTRNGLRCVRSSAFAPFSYLRYAYLQCRMVQSLLEGVEGNSLGISWVAGDVADFDTLFEEIVVGLLESAASLRALCDPRVLAMAQGQSGEWAIPTLRTYLAYGRSATLAAKALFVHRNTLLYRIEKIEGMLGQPLHEMDEHEAFRLQLSCLIADELTKRSREAQRG